MPEPRVRTRLPALSALLALSVLCASASAAPEEVRVRLLTWNVGTLNPLGPRLPKRLEAEVVDTIAGARPEVVTLEEVASVA